MSRGRRTNGMPARPAAFLLLTLPLYALLGVLTGPPLGVEAATPAPLHSHSPAVSSHSVEHGGEAPVGPVESARSLPTEAGEASPAHGTPSELGAFPLWMRLGGLLLVLVAVVLSFLFLLPDRHRQDD